MTTEETILQALEKYAEGDESALRTAFLDTFECLNDAIREYLQGKGVDVSSRRPLHQILKDHSRRLNVDDEVIRQVNAFRIIRNDLVHHREVPARELLAHFIEITLRCLAEIGILIPQAFHRLSEWRPQSSFRYYLDHGYYPQGRSHLDVIRDRVRNLKEILAAPATSPEALIEKVKFADSRRDLLAWEACRLESFFRNPEKLRYEIKQLLISARNELRICEVLSESLQLPPEVVSLLKLRRRVREIEQKLENARVAGNHTETKKAQQELDQVRKALASESAAVRLKIREQRIKQKLANARATGYRAETTRAQQELDEVRRELASKQVRKQDGQ